MRFTQFFVLAAASLAVAAPVAEPEAEAAPADYGSKNSFVLPFTSEMQ